MFRYRGINLSRPLCSLYKTQLRTLSTSQQFALPSRIKEIFTPQYLQERAEEFEKDGYTIIHDLYDPATMDELRDEMDNIINKAEKEKFNDSAIFTTGKNSQHLSNTVDYFLDSASDISFFYEKDAFDENGKLVGPLNTSLNKVGHAMHDLNPVFHKFWYSNAVKTLAKEVLKFMNPMLVQSMYIFKSAKVGGEVTPHQDSTYLISDPLSCKAIWVALDNATTENGCMWGIPGSHKTTPIEYYMKANRKQIKNENGETVKTENTVYYDPEEPPKYVIENEVPLAMNKGSIVLFDGAFVHYSKHNYSEKRRHAFTMHMVEGHKTVWHEDNWLQRKPETPFRYMFEQNPSES